MEGIFLQSYYFQLGIPEVCAHLHQETHSNQLDT